MDQDEAPVRRIAGFVGAFNNGNNAVSRDLLRRLLRMSTQSVQLQEMA